MSILVFGRSGQIARALQKAIGPRGIFLGRDEADLSKPDTLHDIIESHAPRAVINAAAYTQVDKAEEEEALATTINADAPAAMAATCYELGIPFVHYSTDYVFAGDGNAMRDEAEPVAPPNAYGRSKLAGELAVEAEGGQFLIFRTSWVYDAEGKNFFTTMLRLGVERESLNIVNDQIGAPSYAPHLAQATMKALETAMQMDAFPSGVYHMCNAGETNWCEFAQSIFEGARRHGAILAVGDVQGIPSSAYPTPATRPLNSRLDCTKLQAIFGVTMPDWREGLNACLEQTYETA
ncbi:MAG: dTDP-4-dehydrorhamnose reductase [Rickettsiales bacterium]|nr:dTDP-4-dehydrorhamnose reductase [Rickettsiales bacterium]